MRTGDGSWVASLTRARSGHSHSSCTPAEELGARSTELGLGGVGAQTRGRSEERGASHAASLQLNANVTTISTTSYTKMTDQIANRVEPPAISDAPAHELEHAQTRRSKTPDANREPRTAQEQQRSLRDGKTQTAKFDRTPQLEAVSPVNTYSPGSRQEALEIPPEPGPTLGVVPEPLPLRNARSAGAVGRRG